MKLEQRRKSYDWKLGKPKVFGAKGAPRLVPHCTMHREYEARTMRDEDIACQDCGHHVCSCKLPGISAQSFERWDSARPGDVVADIEQALDDFAPKPASELPSPSEWIWSAKPPASELPPGWREAPERCNAYQRAMFVHESGVRSVLRSADPGWEAYWGESFAFASTRDEAMALALGWEKVNANTWDGPGALLRLRASICPDGTWAACDTENRFAPGFASLPHAIAWARGDR